MTKIMPMNEYIYLVCITYNQLSYIKEAITSILNQDYPYLKIIISDDCSSDGTDEAIQRMISTYQGPHQIEFIRQTSNLGLIRNLWSACEKIEDGLVVLAAGDDVSHSNRVSTIHQYWSRLGHPLAIGSSIYLINENGDEIKEVKFFDKLTKIEPRFSIGEEFTFRGASLAFDIQLLKLYEMPKNEKAVEDIIISYRAALNGSSYFIPETLVRYRVVNGSMSHVNNRSVNNYLTSQLKLLTARIESGKAILEDIKRYQMKGKDSEIIEKNIIKSLNRINIEISLLSFKFGNAILNSIRNNETVFVAKKINKLILDIAWISKNRFYSKDRTTQT